MTKVLHRPSRMRGEGVDVSPHHVASAVPIHRRTKQTGKGQTRPGHFLFRVGLLAASPMSQNAKLDGADDSSRQKLNAASANGRRALAGSTLEALG